MHKHRQVLVKMFAKKPNVKQIPPTNEALERHVKRVTYQGGHIGACYC